MANTPLKRLRVEDPLWAAFGDACEAVGTDRTKAVVGFMRRFVDAMSPRSAEVITHPEDPHSRNDSTPSA